MIFFFFNINALLVIQIIEKPNQCNELTIQTQKDKVFHVFAIHNNDDDAAKIFR